MNGLIEEIHFYYNKDGLFVFTEQYHLEKGYCCENGCLHCPYNYEIVKEAKREHLLKSKQTVETNT